MYSIRNFAKYAVGALLTYSVASTAIQNANSQKIKEKTQSVRVNYGLVGDTLSLNPNGNADLILPDSVKIGFGDYFVRTGKNDFTHVAQKIESVNNGVDSFGIVHDTVCFSDKPTITTIKGKLKPIKTILLKAK